MGSSGRLATAATHLDRPDHPRGSNYFSHRANLECNAVPRKGIGPDGKCDSSDRPIAAYEVAPDSPQLGSLSVSSGGRKPAAGRQAWCDFVHAYPLEQEHPHSPAARRLPLSPSTRSKPCASTASSAPTRRWPARSAATRAPWRCACEQPQPPKDGCKRGALYAAWWRMTRTCSDPAHARYRHFGARGVGLAKRWLCYPIFEQWALESGCRRGLCPVRVDLQGDWAPGNCRFVTRREVPHQEHSPPMHLRGKPRWLVEAFGEEMGPTVWSRDRRCAISLGTLSERLREGWRAELAITAPAQVNGEQAGWLLITALGVTESLADRVQHRRRVVTRGGLSRRLKHGVPRRGRSPRSHGSSTVPGARARGGTPGRGGKQFASETTEGNGHGTVAGAPRPNANRIACHGRESSGARER